jgi:Short C-terminal domain
MASCSQCGTDILFGGVKVEDLRFCGRRCHEQHTTWTNGLRSAHQAYQQLLSQLGKTPANPQLKQKALEAGRSYMAWSRQGKGITLFDEVALSNDIQAACAAATPSVASAPPSLPIEQRLERLQILRQKGLLSDEEYDVKRKDILAEL